MSKKGGFGKFLTGAAIGGFLGVLFAPKKGEETRKELSAKLDEFCESLKDIDQEDVKNAFNTQVEKIKTELSELELDKLGEAVKDMDGDKVKEYLSDKTSVLQNDVNKLVDYAKEKGTPVLEKTAEELRDEAIKVSKKVTKKLEESKKESK